MYDPNLSEKIFENITNIIKKNIIIEKTERNKDIL